MAGDPGLIDSEIMPGPLRPLSNDEEKEVFEYQLPGKHRIEFLQRVKEIEDWIANTGYVEKEEVVNYAIARWKINRKQALEYMRKVIADFSQMDRVYGRESNAKKYER